jgi:uncharacterized protein YjbJ (UPF0337 family)
MNWNQVEGYWTQFRGRIREQWGKFSNREIEVVLGRRDQLVGRLQRRYGAAEAHGESTILDFETTSDA